MSTQPPSHVRAPWSSRRLMLTIGVTAVLAAGAGAAIVALASGHHEVSLAARQASVRDHGAMVMPFDLTKTTHGFRDTASGGIETVIAKSPSDTAQVGLARGHLRQEAQKFHSWRLL